jgi:WD40 repeat protein
MSRTSMIPVFKLLLLSLFLLSLLAACSTQAPDTATHPSPLPTAIPPSAEPTSFPVPASPLPSNPVATLGKTPAGTGSRIITLETAGHLVPLNTLGKGALIGSPLYSSDGHWLAVPTAAGVYLYDAQTRSEARLIPQISPTIAFSPDGQSLAAGGANFLSLYKTSDGSLLHNLSDQQGRWYSAIAFSPDGGLVGASNQVQLASQVWSARNGNLRYTLPGEILSFSPSAKFVIALERDKKIIYLYSSDDGSLQNQWPGERAGFLPSGQLWVENAGAVRVMNLQKDLVIAPFNGSEASFSADGSRLALFAQGRIILYEVSTGRVVSTLEGDFSNVEVIQLSNDGTTVAASTSAPMCSGCIHEANPLAVWSAVDGRLIPGMDAIGLANLFSFSPDGQTLTVARAERLEFWRIGESSPVAVIDGFYAGIAGMAVSPDQRTLAVVNDSDPYTIRFWDLVDGNLLDQVQDQNGIGVILSAQVNYSPDGQTLVVGGDVWRQTEGGLWDKFQLTGSEAPPFWASSNAISPDGSLLATGYLDGTLILWNLFDGSAQAKLVGPQGSVDYLAFSPDGKSLAAVYNASTDSLVQVWQIPQRKEVLSLKGARYARLAFSPDGETLVALAVNKAIADYGPQAGFVQFWHIADRTLSLTLKGDDILSVAFSPDGSLLATGSIDGKVRLWQVEGGQLLHTLEIAKESIESLAFTPDGARLVCGLQDGVVIGLGLAE